MQSTVINTQAIEKKTNNLAGDLEVNSIFYTIQGEAIFTGRPSVFIRLAGCNLQCPSCDTEYTNRTIMTANEVLSTVQELTKGIPLDNSTSYNKMLVVITGGEPFRQNLKPLVDLLIDNKFTVQIETNGTLFQELPESVWIVCSPKTGVINSKLEKRVNAYKYVLSHDSVDTDGLPVQALAHPNSGTVHKPSNTFADIYVQPMDAHNDAENQLNLKATIKSAMDYNRILCTQVHKTIGVD